MSVCVCLCEGVSLCICSSSQGVNEQTNPPGLGDIDRWIKRGRRER